MIKENMKKVNTVTIIYYLFLIANIILLIESLIYNDNRHLILILLATTGLQILREILDIKTDSTTILYYLFILVAMILLIKSLFFNDNNHGLLVGITIIGIAVLRKIK